MERNDENDIVFLFYYFSRSEYSSSLINQRAEHAASEMIWSAFI